MLIKPQGGGVQTPIIDKKLLRHLVIDQHKYSAFRNTKPKPMLVISYDDGPLQDYTVAFPIHKQYGVPGELSITSGAITGEYNPFTFGAVMSIEQIREMRDWGFEIAGHGQSHMRLGSGSVASPASSGSTEIYPSVDPSTQQQNFPYKVYLWNRNSGVEETVTITGLTADGKGYTLETPLENGFPVNYTFYSMHEETLDKEIKGCFDDLLEMGIPATHYSYPYNDSSFYSRRVIKKYFNSARQGFLSTLATNNIILPNNSGTPINMYNITSHAQLAGKTTTYIDGLLDDLVATNGFAMTFEHTWATFYPERLEYIFQQCELKGVEVTTRSKALERFGNLFEIGDYGSAIPYVGELPYYTIDTFGKEFTNMSTIELDKV